MSADTIPTDQTGAAAAPSPFMNPDLAAMVANAVKAGSSASGGAIPTTVSGSGAMIGAASPQQTLLQQATAAANTAINGQVTPLVAQQTQLQQQQQQAAKAITTMFNGILPSVADSAARLEQSNATDAAASQQIYSQEGQQQNAIQQNAAANAQKLAQSIGGPVSTGQFTAASDPYAAATAESGATDALTTIGLGKIGNTAAEAFAGQVFPALATEQQAQNRAYYQDKITSIQDEISKIKATKGTLVNSGLARLQTQQKTWELDQAKLALTKQKMTDDWNVKQTEIAQKDRALAQGDYKLAQADRVINSTVGYRNDSIGLRKTAAAQNWVKIADASANAAAKMGLSRDKLAQSAQQFGETHAIAAQRLTLQEEKNAMSLVTAATGMGSGANSNKPVTITKRINLTPDDPAVIAALTNPQHPPADIHVDPKTHQWYQYRTQHLTPSQIATASGVPGSKPISDPDRMYHMLIMAGTKPSIAIATIQANPVFHGWKGPKK